jgi:uncharacterized protein YdhG (YjbR/CyaY superfamily)
VTPARSPIDDYIAALPPDRRGPMNAIRDAVRAVAPGATETIAYKMPAYRTVSGQFLVSFDAYKHHYSLFPASEAVIQGLGAALEPHLAGSGTIRFPAAQPIPVDLVRRIVEIRVAELGTGEG